MFQSLQASVAFFACLASTLCADHLEITNQGSMGIRFDAIRFDAEFNLVEVVENLWRPPQTAAQIHPQQGPEVLLETESRFESGSAVAWQRSGKIQGARANFTETWQSDPIKGFAEIKVVSPVGELQGATAEILDSSTKQITIADLIEKKEEWVKGNGNAMTVKNWNGATVTFQVEETSTFWVMVEYDAAKEQAQHVVLRIHSGEPTDMEIGEFRWSVEAARE